MHYRDFFDNWAAQLSNLGLEKDIGVVAIAEDADIVDHLQQWRKSAPPGTYRRVAQSLNKQPLARGELGFYTDGFAKLMSRRARHLIGAHAALRRQWGDDPRARLIFTDLDAFWLRDPRPYFRRRLRLVGADAAPREGAAEPRLPGPDADGRRGEAVENLGRAPREGTRPQPAALQPRPPGAATAAALQTGDLRARFGSLRLGEAELLPAALVGARPGICGGGSCELDDGHDAKHKAFVEKGLWVL